MSVESELRVQALERDGYVCVWPGCHATWRLEMAHLLPKGSGGKNVIGNVAMMCKYHHAMHDGREPRKLREYRLLMIDYIAVRYGR